MDIIKNHWEFFAGLIAILAGAWGRVKQLGSWLASVFVVTCKADPDLARALQLFLEHKQAKPPVSGQYSMDQFPIRAERAMRWVAYRDWVLAPKFYFYGWRPLRGATSKVNQGTSSEKTEYTFSFVRGTVPWAELVERAAEYYNVHQHELTHSRWKTIRHCIVHHHGSAFLGIERDKDNKPGTVYRSVMTGWDPNSKDILIGRRPHELGSWSTANPQTLALSPELQRVSVEIDRFMNSREWYEEHGLTWRRGFGFRGDPGTGKTSFAREQAQKHDLPVHVMDLASMSNQELRQEWKKALESAPCMILIEDIDAVFHGRVNVSKGSALQGGLTFDTLLNVVDGIDRTPGVLLVISTNHPEHVDAALARAGRIDRWVDFPALGIAERRLIACRILGDTELAERVIRELGDVSGADVQEACTRLALERLFATPESDDEPERPRLELVREVPK